MTFPTHAHTSAKRPIADLVAEAPAGTVPMFVVSEGYEDSVLGTHVYIKDGHVHDCITDERVSQKLITGLRFLRYIKS